MPNIIDEARFIPFNDHIYRVIDSKAETGLCSRASARNSKKRTTMMSSQPAPNSRLPFGTIFSTKLMLISGRRDVDRGCSTGFHVGRCQACLVCAFGARCVCHKRAAISTLAIYTDYTRGDSSITTG